MNGKRAKKIRQETAALVKDIKLDDNQPMYHQLQNCRDWEQARDKDGKPMFDADSVALIQMVKKPGTVKHAMPFMIIYRLKKKQYYQARARERGSI